jgi:hypothetical protein
MAERPILFSGPLVRVILEGRKTQTRRVVKREPLAWLEDFAPEFVADPGNHLSPYGHAGDRLWVRERFDLDRDFDDMSPAEAFAHCGAHGHRPGVRYAADGISAESWARDPWGKPRPSIHMPRWASRIDLEVTDVRIERLQAITEEDAVAEGITSDPADLIPARDVFADLWQQINGNHEGCSWAANPWVWVVSFRRVEVRHGG